MRTDVDFVVYVEVDVDDDDDVAESLRWG